MTAVYCSSQSRNVKRDREEGKKQKIKEEAENNLLFFSLFFLCRCVCPLPLFSFVLKRVFDKRLIIFRKKWPLQLLQLSVCSLGCTAAALPLHHYLNQLPLEMVCWEFILPFKLCSACYCHSSPLRKYSLKCLMMMYSSFFFFPSNIFFSFFRQ